MTIPSSTPLFSPSGLLQGGSSHASASMSPSDVPILDRELTSISGTAAHTTIDLKFNTPMATSGHGKIIVTDGAAQTVIDRTTGLPTLRIVGATHTREIDLDSLEFSGNHVLIDAFDLKPDHAYSVYITPGALTSSTGLAFAGLPTGNTVFFETLPASDPGRPTLLGIEFDSSMLKVGQDITVTFEFSEKVERPGLGAFSTPHAELVDFSTTDGGRTWHARLHANDMGKLVEANEVAVNMAMIIDMADVHGAGTSTSTSHYGVDTLVSAVVAPAISLADDAGPFSNDHISVETAIEGTINGTIGSDQHLEVRINGGLVNSEAISRTPVAGGYTWSYHGPVPEGTSTVTAQIVNDTGHSSAPVSQVITIDNSPPAMVTSPDGSTDFGVASPIVITFDQQVYWGDGSAAHDLLVIKDADGNERPGEISRASLSADGRTLTIPASALGLAPGGSYIIYMPVTLTDLAGNVLPQIHLHTAPALADVTPPTAISATVTNLAGSYGVGAAIEIRIAFDEPVKLLGDAIPSLTLNNGGSAAFVTFNEANEMVFKYTVAAAHDVDALDIEDASSLNGSVTDLAGNPLSISSLGLGNAIAEIEGSGIVIDTLASALAAPLLASHDDSGASDSDGITKEDSPTFSGTGAEADATIKVYANELYVGVTTASGSGSWSYTLHDLSDGSYSITTRQVDAAGNESAHSEAGLIVIDHTAPTFTKTGGLGSVVIKFDEKINVGSVGSVTLSGGLFDLSGLLASWSVEPDGGGHDVSVLRLSGLLGGVTYTLHTEHAVTDLAGNEVDLVGINVSSTPPV